MPIQEVGPRFPNTSQGRVDAEAYSYSIGRRGYWEEFVDHDEEATIESNPESVVLKAISDAITRNPGAFTPEQRTRVAELISTHLGIPGVDAQAKFVEDYADHASNLVRPQDTVHLQGVS